MSAPLHVELYSIKAPEIKGQLVELPVMTARMEWLLLRATPELWHKAIADVAALLGVERQPLAQPSRVGRRVRVQRWLEVIGLFHEWLNSRDLTVDALAERAHMAPRTMTDYFTRIRRGDIPAEVAAALKGKLPITKPNGRIL